MPFIGLGVGIVSGIYDFCQGNYGYGLLNIAQGAVSTIPGVGTGLSIAMGVGIGALRVADIVSETNRVTTTTIADPATLTLAELL